MAEGAAPSMSGWDLLDRALSTAANIYSTEKQADAAADMAAAESSRMKTAALQAETANAAVTLAGVEVQKSWLYMAGAVAVVAVVFYMVKRGKS